MTPLSQNCGQKLGNAFKVDPDLSFLKPFQYQEISCLALQKIVHLLFCVFQTKLDKAVNIFCRPPEWIRKVKMIPGFSTIKSWIRILHG